MPFLQAEGARAEGKRKDLHYLSEMQDRVYQEELGNILAIFNRDCLKSSVCRNAYPALSDARFEMIYSFCMKAGKFCIYYIK